MRLIDADALKEMKFSGGMHDDNWIVYVPFREVVENIDKAPTVGDWISVKDRPPEEDEIIYTAKPRKTIEQIMDELIQEAQNEPEWKAESALKCAKRILLAEYKPYSPMSQIKQDVNGLGYMWRCPICQKDIHEGDKYCSNCGRKMKWN